MDRSTGVADAEAEAALHQGVRRRIEAARSQLLELSHAIHADPELGFGEHRASERVATALAQAGFTVSIPFGGLETALRASIGSGDLHLALIAEYDALPGVGHACGHNIIAATAVGAALASAPLVDELGLRISVIGTPAEEGGAGKALLLDAGAFDDVHAALMIHPGPADSLAPHVLAAQLFEIEYRGREAHASAYPERGVNAADALVVAQTAIGLLRQQLRSTDRVHGIVTNGGVGHNIIPAYTAAQYMVRAETIEELEELRTKVLRCFEAGALATGAVLSVEAQIPYTHMDHDPELLERYRVSAEALGRRWDTPPEGVLTRFSTDMGNVSLAVPSIHPIIGIDSLPAVNHQPEFTAACISEAADRAVIDGAIALAWTVIDTATSPDLRERLLAR